MSVKRARQLRKQLTEHEVKVWSALRELRPQGLHFRRQAPLDGYILDFVCHRARLIVEIDGVQHAEERQRTRDSVRDAHFAGSGYRTLRYWNHEVDQRLDELAEGIFRIAMERIGEPSAQKTPTRHPASPAATLPAKGEG